MAYKIRKVTRYRNPKTGRLQKKKTKTSIEEHYVYQTTDKGKIIRGQRELETSFIGKVGPDDFNNLPRTKKGLINAALDQANIRSPKNLKGAKQLVITIRGKDYRDKEKRIKSMIDVRGEKNLADVMTGRIIGLIHDKGYRPQYSLDVVPWGRTEVSKSFSRSKKQLHDLEIIIEIKK